MKNSKDKPIILYVYDFDFGVGGIKVTHYLCHLLNELGYECYLYPIHIKEEFCVNASYNTPLIPIELANNLDECIVVYMDGVRGNPLNAKNIVRWVLGPCHMHMEHYNKNELVYWYADFYYEEYLGQRENQLLVVGFQKEIFYDQKLERKGSCYCIRKCPDPKFIHPDDSIFIPYHAAGDLAAMANVFNRTEIFYCYDDHCFLSVQAAASGCISVVVPRGKSKEEYLSGSRLNKYGIAYGIEDIPRAIETLPLFFKELELIEQEEKKHATNFYNHCQKHFNQ